MSKRGRQRRRKGKSQPAASPPVAKSGNSAAVSWFRGLRVWLASGVVLALALFMAYRWRTVYVADSPAPLAENRQPPKFVDTKPSDPGAEEFHGHHPETKGVQEKPSDSFLDDFNREKPDAETGNGGEEPAVSDLEKRFQALVKLNDRIEDLRQREVEPGAFARVEDQTENDRLVHEFDRESAALDKQLNQARHAHPEDAMPRWLTGELLNLIDGEPESMMSHLEFALAHGLKRARLFASLSRGHLRANQFADAYRFAVKAVELGGQDRYEWGAFLPAAVAMNHFDEIVDRLNRTFPAGPPDWAKTYWRDAVDLQSRWIAEQKIRLAEARADDLPRVQLVIEHRRFARDKSGQPLTTVESTGREQVILELFENEAPNTVANFIELVERKFYDGTRFHLAYAPKMVLGGDPNSKNEDPSGDGPGGPGYVIPDECQSPGARSLFHGSLCMFDARPGTAGSQFFFALVPPPGKNTRFTVFGRILENQDAVDRITRGHTNPQVRGYGKIILGDLLVRAEVIRKRSHEYHAIKESP